MNVFDIQYTIEYKNDKNELNLLDVTIKNNLNHTYGFAVYYKPAITNVQIKPKDLTSNSKLVLLASCISLMFKTALTNEAEILQSYIIDFTN